MWKKVVKTAPKILLFSQRVSEPAWPPEWWLLFSFDSLGYEGVDWPDGGLMQHVADRDRLYGEVSIKADAKSLCTIFRKGKIRQSRVTLQKGPVKKIKEEGDLLCLYNFGWQKDLEEEEDEKKK